MPYDAGDDDMTDQHTKSTCHQKLPASPSVNEEYSREGEKKIDNTEDASSEERSSRPVQSKPPKDCWSIVDNCINSSELLEEHEDTTQGETTEKTSVGEQHAHFRDVKHEARLSREQLCSSALIKNDCCLDLEPFCLDDGIILRKCTKSADDCSGLLVAAFRHEPTRTVW